MILSNRKWQNHFKSKGFTGFMHDRLLSYSLAMGQYKTSPFEFKCEDHEENPLIKYTFEFMEEFPYDIYIEVTNECNLNCLFCAREKMTRGKGFMSDDIFKKIIDEIAEKRPFAYVHLYGIGESTLDPKLLDKIEYALKKGIKNMILFTNGQNLHKDNLYKKLVDLGIMAIGVDFDGYSAESYQKLRKGGNFKLLNESVKKLKTYIDETGARTRLELAFQVYPGINDHEIEDFSKWCNDNDYEYKLVPMHKWAGLKDEVNSTSDYSDKVKRERPCTALWNGFLINWNGDVALCFHDADGKELMGNVTKQALEDIWKGKARQKRREHVNGIFDGLCKGCQDFIMNTPPPTGSKVYPPCLRDVEENKE